MPLTENWWKPSIDWETPAGQLLRRFVASLPTHRPFQITVFGSAPLQLTVDRDLLSGDVDIFSDDDEDLSALIASAKLDNDELKEELQSAVDLFRPAFDDDAPNRYPNNTRQLWLELFKTEIDIRRDIIEPALIRRRQGYGEPPPNYRGALGN